MESVTARLEDLDASLRDDEAGGAAKPLLHPAMAQRYRREVENLRKALDRVESRGEAQEHLRSLIEKIVLTPQKGRENLRIDLYGDLAGILTIASRSAARDGHATTGGAARLKS